MKKECCNINEVVQEYYNFLKSYITRKVNDPIVAEDIVQQVMVKLIESHAKSPEVSNIKAWLFQVSRNTIYDYYKKRNLHVDMGSDWDHADESTSENSKVIVEDYVVPMIQLLEEKYAIPLKMSDIDGISQKEVAKRLGLSLSAAKMRVQRGRIKLQELFIECCEIEYDQNGGISSCTIKEYCEPLKNIEKKLNT